MSFHQCTDTSRMMMMKHSSTFSSSSYPSSYQSSSSSAAALQNCSSSSSYVINSSTAFNASPSAASFGAVNHHHHSHHQLPFATSYDVSSNRTSTVPSTVCLSSSVRTVILTFHFLLCFLSMMIQTQDFLISLFPIHLHLFPDLFLGIELLPTQRIRPP